MMNRKFGIIGTLAAMLYGNVAVPGDMAPQSPGLKKLRNVDTGYVTATKVHEVLAHGKKEFYVNGVRLISYNVKAAEKKFNRYLLSGKIVKGINGYQLV